MGGGCSAALCHRVAVLSRTVSRPTEPAAAQECAPIRHLRYELYIRYVRAHTKHSTCPSRWGWHTGTEGASQGMFRSNTGHLYTPTYIHGFHTYLYVHPQVLQAVCDLWLPYLCWTLDVPPTPWLRAQKVPSHPRVTGAEPSMGLVPRSAVGTHTGTFL